MLLNARLKAKLALEDIRGGIAVTFALVVPVLAVVAIGATELAMISAQKASMQAIADAAALSAAAEAIVAPVGAAERAKAYATEELASISEPTTTSVVTAVEPGGSLRVTISGHRPSLLANLLPPGGWRFGAEAVAHAMNLAPLCVLAQGPGESKAINLLDSAQISARACLLHSNEDVTVEGSASIVAALVQAGGVGRGRIMPAAEGNATELEDPFADKVLQSTKACSDQGRKLEAGNHSLAAGVHCGKVEVAKGASLTLSAGEHYFRGSELNVKDTAQLRGSDVVLFFDKDSKVKWQDQARVNLEGRRTGAHAGFVLITDRGHTNDLDLWSDSIDVLLGVVYAPNAKLIVDGKEEVAEGSDWTVIVAKAIQLKGSAKLVINTDYAASAVAVPQGVGPTGAAVRLGR